MKHTRMLVTVIALLVALVPLGAQPALAGTYTTSGVLNSADSTLPQVGIITTPICAGAYVAFAVQYEAVAFTVSQTASYSFDETASPSTAMYLIEGSFDPAAVATNCVAASNTNPLHIDYPLTAGTTYYLVVINDTFAQTPLNYTLTISGPGEIYVVGAPGGCDVTINIPSTAVGATFVADAPVYWAPGNLTDPVVTLQAGKSVRAIGLDATGQYYKILFVCSYLWVPANTLGPNYDAVWNGAPLPTTVVD